ncbi:MAG TPA: hypothetical protein VF657_11545 [Actinoplanes sp.]
MVQSDAHGTTGEVVVLVSGDSDRSRLVAALQRAGYSVTQSRHPKEWGFVRRPPVLVTEDTADGARLRTAATPETPCVVLTRDATPTRYQELLATGTSALPAEAAVEDVVFAVGAAARSLACVPAVAARTLDGPGGERPVLSQRERRWLRALAHGDTVVTVARASGYSEREMYRLLRALYVQLGAGSRTEALLRAGRWGLLPGPPERQPVPVQR